MNIFRYSFSSSFPDKYAHIFRPIHLKREVSVCLIPCLDIKAWNSSPTKTTALLATNILVIHELQKISVGLLEWHLLLPSLICKRLSICWRRPRLPGTCDLYMGLLNQRKVSISRLLEFPKNVKGGCWHLIDLLTLIAVSHLKFYFLVEYWSPKSFCLALSFLQFLDVPHGAPLEDFFRPCMGFITLTPHSKRSSTIPNSCLLMK